MALQSQDPRAFVLAQLKGRGNKKRSTADAQTKSTVLKKRQPQPTKKATPPLVQVAVEESNGPMKRLRQDTLEWKLLSAQPEDFEDIFEQDISTEKDTSDKTKTRARKSDNAMTNLFDNEGGMMMLEEVDNVDVVWEEDGKGGKKATLIEAKPKKVKQPPPHKAESSKKQQVAPSATTTTTTTTDVKPRDKPKNNKRKRSTVDEETDSKETVDDAATMVVDAKDGGGDVDSSDDVEMASEGKDEQGTDEEDAATGVQSLSTYERARHITFDGKSQPSPSAYIPVD
ncbi:hypothetical protein QFC22_000450 [Naganishia vaughanmartiniae]|uniref:Uncharacterized protein n=1 Tax=Naganishia vaughanmartiniae TaxID=1424756 RepID=A0ACC2XQ49_9TREE|nr:hypothetical protein QFC22_000450 [Naganishia vaughanmartiniae]